MTMQGYRCSRVGLATGVLAFAIWAVPAAGQCEPPPNGQWAGPYALEVLNGPQGMEFAEIAHAAVLPPPC